MRAIPVTNRGEVFFVIDSNGSEFFLPRSRLARKDVVYPVTLYQCYEDDAEKLIKPALHLPPAVLPYPPKGYKKGRRDRNGRYRELYAQQRALYTDKHPMEDF